MSDNPIFEHMTMMNTSLEVRDVRSSYENEWGTPPTYNDIQLGQDILNV